MIPIEITEDDVAESVITIEEPDWYLGISKRQFKEIYGKSVDIKLFTVLPKSDDDLRDNYLTSKLWRLNNLYTIVDKDGIRIPFRMNYAQHRVYAASLQHPRLIILKSRQQGISTFWLVSYLDDALTIPDYNIGLMAQGIDEAATLLKRVKVAWEEFPEELIIFFGLAIVRDNASEVAFNNGSTIFIRTSFRSTTLQRLHISEYGKIANKTPERAIETKTGTLQAIKPGMTVVIESTAEGDNDFKAMWDLAIEAEQRSFNSGTGLFSGKDFKPVFLSMLDDPDCISDMLEVVTPKQVTYFESIETLLKRVLPVEQRNFWVAQYRELEDRIYQEYPITPEEAFTKLNEGSFYGMLYLKYVIKKNRLVKNLYDKNLEVNVAMDLGISESDVFTLVYFQRFGEDWRIINEYTNFGEGLSHYVNHMNDTGYYINYVIAPHDIKVKELGTGKARLQILRDLGVKKVLTLPKLPVIDGIECMRQVMPYLWIDETCTYTQKCLKNYSREWNEKLNTWHTKANHDKWSHGADALRYMALSQLRRKRKTDVKSIASSITVVDGMAF